MDKTVLRLPFDYLSGDEGGGLPRLVPLASQAMGVLRGRVWELRLEVWSEQNPDIPNRPPTAAEQVGVALAVLRWAVLQALAETTSSLRARLRRIGTRALTRRPR